MDLSDSLERLATAPTLLVASDYDGTLSPIVEDPSKAVPDRESIVALRALAQIPGTHVAEPTAISPVLVSTMRIDHVAEAGAQASPVPARRAAAERERTEGEENREPVKKPMNTLLQETGNDRGGARQI